MRLIITASIKYPNKTIDRAKEAVPYLPGEYDFGYEYPFSKNIWLSMEKGYFFGRMTINEDYSIDYMCRRFFLPESGTITLEEALPGRSISITITLDEKRSNYSARKIR